MPAHQIRWESDVQSLGKMTSLGGNLICWSSLSALLIQQKGKVLLDVHAAGVTFRVIHVATKVESFRICFEFGFGFVICVYLSREVFLLRMGRVHDAGTSTRSCSTTKRSAQVMRRL